MNSFRLDSGFSAQGPISRDGAFRWKSENSQQQDSLSHQMPLRPEKKCQKGVSILLVGITSFGIEEMLRVEGSIG